MTDAHTQARNIALQLLGGREVVTSDNVREAVTRTARMFDGLDVERLVLEVETLCNVWVPRALALEGDDEHVPWLELARPEIEWGFWDRYRRYLEEEKGWAPAQLRNLHEVTDDILGRFENPGRNGAWDRRGMVVGQVQSGKTANYTGLICKAADAGYRLIIVLAGMHDSLRSQTQQRLDREFLGFDTMKRLSPDQGSARVGVGNLKGEQALYAHSLTSAADKGDFRRQVAEAVWVNAGGRDPVLLVVKKNASVLKNLYGWATDVQRVLDPETGRHIVRNVPLLVIDDEADNASVNTKVRPTDENGQPVDDYDPTKINGWIRRLLHTFEQSAYLAYTATPFANIFIDGDEETTTYGEELFPRSFIVSLRPPTNYTGVARVFGVDADVTAGIEGRSGLPVLRHVQDHDDWLPDKHRKDHIPGALPASLIQAVDAFLLATAARDARGQLDHNTMLIHVTRFTAVQALVRRQLDEHIQQVRDRIRYSPDGPDSPLPRLEQLWHSDFEATTAKFLRNPELLEGVGAEIPWEKIRKRLPEVLERLQLRTMNGTSDDCLAYTQSPDPLTLIAIGGDKLSRGLTLEGLTVSYYLRASKMYDTLMQMGRWFGYRPGYLDVCRLYTTPELEGWYRDISLANEELLREFEYMVALGRNPSDYGLRVRAHPDGLMITASAKMKNGRYVEVTFSQTISESISFSSEASVLDSNMVATQELCAAAGVPRRKQDERGRDIELGTLIWDDVPVDYVLTFLDRYTTPATATKAQPKALAAYINSRLQLDIPELTSWTVALVSSSASNATPHAVDGHDIGLITRAWSPRAGGPKSPTDDGPVADFVIRRLVSPADETLDLTQQQENRALSETVANWEQAADTRRTNEPSRPGGLEVRAARSPSHGLLLLYPLEPQEGMPKDKPAVGFAVSFPRSRSDRKVRYRVTNLYWDQEFGAQGDEAQE